MALATQCEINVDEVGVNGAKTFFEAKVLSRNLFFYSNVLKLAIFFLHRLLQSEKQVNLKKKFDQSR